MNATNQTRLDAVNIRILQHLTKEGRATYKSLADRLRLSINTIRARMEAMEQRGLIRGYRAVIDEEKVGAPVHALAFLPLGNADPTSVPLPEHSTIRDAYRTNNGFGLILEMVGASIDDLSHVLQEHVYPLGFGRADFLALANPHSERIDVTVAGGEQVAITA